MIPPKEPWTRFSSQEEKLDFMKRNDFAAPTDSYAKLLTYSGGYANEPVDCILLGYIDNNTLVIQVLGEEHCINADCLLDMQAGIRSASLPEEYVVLDVETTGFSPKTAWIIEVAAVRYQNGEAVASFTSLVNPGCIVPPVITALTGISNADLAGAPPFADIIPVLENVIGKLPIVAHNAKFDMGFLSAAYAEAGIELRNRPIDTLAIAKKAFPGLESYRLECLKTALHLPERPSHRALDDVYTTAELLSRCVAEIRMSKRENELLASAAAPVSESDTENPKKAAKYKKKPGDIVPTVTEIDPGGPLYGKCIVFTGEMRTSRSDAMQMAVNAGAIIKTSVSKKVDYLVIGKQDPALVGENGLSTKEEKAYALISENQAKIQIINEDDFLALVNGGSANE